jgi:hypothetical protein
MNDSAMHMGNAKTSNARAIRLQYLLMSTSHVRFLWGSKNKQPDIIAKTGTANTPMSFKKPYAYSPSAGMFDSPTEQVCIITIIIVAISRSAFIYDMPSLFKSCLLV